MLLLPSLRGGASARGGAGAAQGLPAWTTGVWLGEILAARSAVAVAPPVRVHCREKNEDHQRLGLDR